MSQAACHLAIERNSIELQKREDFLKAEREKEREGERGKGKKKRLAKNELF